MARPVSLDQGLPPGEEFDPPRALTTAKECDDIEHNEHPAPTSSRRPPPADPDFYQVGDEKNDKPPHETKEVLERLDRIEEKLARLIELRTIKDWYTTAEVAEFLGKSEFTVREWCRLGRVRASKRKCGRGLSQEWIVAHEELERYRNEGLLPQPSVSTRL
ncbi:MAG: helix-turn-helix domain-containing protein [Planctomycetes bacterium]|nr:helix-turn-helix domain-containing protein [Planctomycetota bacterium]